MSFRYLDQNGAVSFWTNIKNYILSKVPTKTSELTNDSGFLTSHQSLSNYVTLNSEQTITGKKLFTNATTKVNSVNTFTGSTQFIDLSTTVPRGSFPESGHRVGRVYIGDNTSYNGAWFIIDPTIDTDKAYYRMVTTSPDNTDSTRFSITWDSTKEGARRRRLVCMGDLICATNNTYQIGESTSPFGRVYANEYKFCNAELLPDVDVQTNEEHTIGFYGKNNTPLSYITFQKRTGLADRVAIRINTSSSAYKSYCFDANCLYPEVDNSLDIGSSLKIFKNIYCNNYYKGTTAFGDIVTHNASEFLTQHPSITLSTNTTSTASPSHGGTFTCIDSVTQDTNGHITKVNTKTVTLPSDNNTDTKVKQYEGTTNQERPILSRYNSTEASQTANFVVYDTGVTSNPTKHTITASGGFVGNASSATEFKDSKSVTLTGDVTGSVSSKAGWTVSTTLANSGVTAGTYGPSADVTGTNNTTILVPEITVDAKGRVTSVTNRTYTSVNSDSDKKVYQYYKSDDNVYRLLFSNNSGNTATSNVGAVYSGLNNSFYVNPSTGVLHSNKLTSNFVDIQGSYLGNEPSTNGRTCLYLKANRDTDGKSGLYVAKFRQNVAQGSMGSSDVVFLSHDILENETRTNAGFIELYSNWEDDVPKGMSVYSSIATRNLGTSANPWTNTYAVNFYENGTALSDKYLTVSAISGGASTSAGDITPVKGTIISGFAESGDVTYSTDFGAVLVAPSRLYYATCVYNTSNSTMEYSKGPSVEGTGTWKLMGGGRKSPGTSTRLLFGLWIKIV